MCSVLGRLCRLRLYHLVLLTGLLSLSGLLAGCQSTSALVLADPGCEQVLERFEHRIANQQSTDVQSPRIGGVPFLRSNRFLASYARASLTAEQQREWLVRAYQLGVHDWRIEMANAGFSQADQAVALSCAALALGKLSLQPQRVTKLRKQSAVDDNYSLSKRILGLYPLTRLAARSGARELEQEAQARFKQPPPETRYRYQLPEAGWLAASERRQIMTEAYGSSVLGIPEPKSEQLAQLFSHFAPVVALEVTGHADLPGHFILNRQRRPWLDLSQAALYTRHEFTRLDDEVLLQLSYTLWFAERPPWAGGRLYSGLYDGLTWRVTLDRQGQPLLYDSVHPCGCYHKFYPLPASARPASPYLRLRPGADALESVVLPLPPDFSAEHRVQIHLQSGTHYVTGISSASTSQALSYQLAPYDQLRQLTAPGQVSRSLFGSDGLIAGSQRLERFVLWPMGIRSAGAMRQQGSQAVAFTSRRHFDDADLPGQLFELSEPARVSESDEAAADQAKAPQHADNAVE